MNKNAGLWLGGLFVLFSFNVFAQTYAEEALFFSRLNPAGSARIQAMGGAQVALGGDYSSAYSNPAGLGFFNRSEATLSLGINSYSSTSSYLGSSTTDSKSNFNIPGFSLVLHTDKHKGKLVSGNFAISFTRTNNFNQNYTYQGTNSSSSIIDYFIQQASSYAQPPGQLFYPGDINNPPGDGYNSLPRLAYNTYLIGPNSEKTLNADSTYYHSYPLDNRTQTGPVAIKQSERIQNSGAQNQWNIAYGINLNDFFYLGAGLGVPTINYQSQKVYSESFPLGSLPAGGNLTGFELDENLHVTGTGINATIGAIVKPKDFVQFGLSISTPTYYPTLSENYNATLTSVWNNYNFVDVTHQSKSGNLNGGLRDSIYFQTPFLYSLTTPWRIKAGATFFIQKRGLITAEVEKVNFSKSQFGSNSNTPSDFSGDNGEIKNLFHNVFNFRVGGEYRFSNFRARLGYNYMPNPYSTSQNNIDNTVTSISAGLGYRSKKYFVDLGFIQTSWSSSYLPYSRGTVRYSDDVFSPIVTIKNSSISGMLTVGFIL